MVLDQLTNPTDNEQVISGRFLQMETDQLWQLAEMFPRNSRLTGFFEDNKVIFPANYVYNQMQSLVKIALAA